MDLEKFTERAKGFLQAAQTLAIRLGQQRISPEHILKALLEDDQGMAAGLIERAGGTPGIATRALDADLARIPKVSGSGAQSPPQLDNDAVRLLDAAEQIAKKAGDSYVTVERLRCVPGTAVAALADADVTAGAQRRDQQLRGGRTRETRRAPRIDHAHSGSSRAPDAGGARRLARPGHRPTRSAPGDSGAADQDNPADRRPCRQDRHRRRPAPHAAATFPIRPRPHPHGARHGRSSPARIAASSRTPQVCSMR